MTDDLQRRWEVVRDTYVIKPDGTYVGDYEAVHRSCEDPWLLEAVGIRSPLRKLILLRIAELPLRRVMDIGCGKGAFTDQIRSETGAEVIGLDVSPTAIASARAKYPLCRFEVASASEIARFADFKSTAVCMYGVTWYMLDCFKDVLASLKKHYRDAMLFHALAFYSPQRYGTEYFRSLEELLPYFSAMKVEETFVRRTYPNNGSYQSLLIGRI